MARAYIGIGSNIEPEENIRKALGFLCLHASVKRISTVYRTPAEGRPWQPPFYNLVAEVETRAAPEELKFGILRRIEASLGRKRTKDKSAARTIDLDLLLYDEMVLRSGRLNIPDPQIELRAFVALPLEELSPGLRLPGSGLPIAAIASSLDKSEMEPLKQYTEALRKEICDHGRGEGKTAYKGTPG